MNDQDRRSMPLFSISIVKQLTELTARQIRYYESHGLITPARTSGNQRLFSFNDVDCLLEIKKLLDKGVNLAGIKKIMLSDDKCDRKEMAASHDLSDRELRKYLKVKLTETTIPGRSHLHRGELSRFFQ
ncbi:MerR family transcriptional regulator [Lentibacillus cibarius]|uniref:MerR family transcriptional regulator n=1 Tax=Lentibacillus cibarius TaxID=2583219 RepID=A0A5S3QPB4_9BACI|nr:MerR family transcriptional regulator [Lentibacillus cibarius]TMN23649.1 MerR family transcriptional regulator [Lentibacillus cibarius]